MKANIAAKLLLVFVATLLLHASSGRAQQSSIPQFGRLQCSGAGPYPCARTDLNVQQESAPPGWSWNPSANTVQNDPDFGSPILRVTDNNTLTSPTCFDRPSTKNTSLSSPASPEVNVFSSDDKWIRVSDQWGEDWLMSFSPTTLQVGCSKVAISTNGQLPWSFGIFGRAAADAGQYFGVESRYILAKYDVTQYSNPSNYPATIMDLSQCSGLSFLRSLSNQATEWSPTPSLSLDDNRIMYTVGPVQNEGWLSVVYDQGAKACGWVDLRTGQIGGNLWPEGQMTGAFPLNFDQNGGPAVPVVAPTTIAGGGLIPGHTYELQYSLVYETNENGTGESAASPVQWITVGGANNAIALPSPAASAKDSMVWTHYNVYACDQTASPGCAPTLQPAANLGCTMGRPHPTATVVGSAGSTAYNYIEEAVGPNCNTWGSVSVTNGPQTLTSQNYIKVTASAVSGASVSRYRLITGNWVSGTATVDQGYLPGEIHESASTGSFNDNGGELVALSAVGTIPAGTASTLKAITGGGPPPPAVSTLGVFLHAQLMSLDGNWVSWGQQALQGSEVFWSLGAPSSEWCNLTAADENPPDSYVACVGHWVMGYQGPILSGGEPGQTDRNFDENWRPYSAIHSLDVPAGSVVRVIANFPALDPVCGVDYYDQHQSWNSSNGLGDLSSPFLVSTDEASSSSCQGPTYIGRAWAREIYVVDPSTGIVYRIAHHRASGTAYWLAKCSVSPHCESDFSHASLADVSTSGRFAMFTSDMEWHLGCDPMTGDTCTYNSNGQVISGEARGDVWIVGLNPATSKSSRPLP
ncbi:MAG TPA: hypothetical protein VMT20_14940 [Terriglobia bacterium]|nr:hypothetical protein [Terriglobia bacterium]